MTAATKYSTAFSVGQALGRVARFFMHDRNPFVRWGKRLFVATVMLLLLVNSISWIMSALLTVVSLTLGLFALSKVDLGQVELFSEDEEAPYGRDVFERPLDSHGRPVK